MKNTLLVVSLLLGATTSAQLGLTQKEQAINSLVSTLTNSNLVSHSSGPSASASQEPILSNTNQGFDPETYLN